MNDTSVVVPPRFLVEAFGAPELVRLPARVGEVSTFHAHGHGWRIHRLSRHTWTLCKSRVAGSRVRFGTRAEIAQDVGFVLETGRLPKSDAATWA